MGSAEKVSWKRVLILAGAIIAFTIGSGFATGQEIIQYYTAYGVKGLLVILVFLIAFLYYNFNFAKAGADSMSIHVEATNHIHGALQKIKNAGMKASVVINPGTPVEAIKTVLPLVDMVLVMTVNPGFGGQKFIPEMMDKVRELTQIRTDKKLNFEIEVDGGIDDQTIQVAKAAGANVFVAGSFVFNGEVEKNIEKLRENL